VKARKCPDGSDPKCGAAQRQADAPEVGSVTKGHTDKTHPVENRLGKLGL